MRYFTIRAICIPGLLVLFWGTPSHGQRVSLPEGIFYYQPAASVFGAEAAWVNPAGLAAYHASSFQVMAEYSAERFARSWGTVVNRDRLALACRNLYNPDGEDHLEYVFASAMSLGGRLHLGGSYRYFKEAPDDLIKRHFWNIGLMSTGRGKFKWGAVLSNLNHSRNTDGRRTETEQRYSISYRPLDRILTLSADMFLSTGTRLSNAEYVYHVELASRRGLYVSGQLDSHRNFQIGLRVNLLQYFVGTASLFDRKPDHLRTVAYFGGTSMRQPTLIPEKRRRLMLSIAGSPHENPPHPIFGRKRTPFATLLMNIYRAAEDQSVSEMVVSLKGMSLGFAQAQELREALGFFRKHGKSITCHVTYPGNISYYVATVADRILIPPVSQLNLVGLRAELTFYAGTLDKLGVKADLMRVGDYKTAAEQYTGRRASPECRRQINRLLDDIYDQFVAGIAEGRSVDADSVRRIIDNGPFTSAEAMQYGLVDGLSYLDELDETVLWDMPAISFKRYLGDTLINDGWPGRPVIAVVVADGDIVTDGKGVLPFGNSKKVTPGSMRQAFGRAVAEPRVKGILFRINSPGGFALAGEEIYRAAQTAGEKKPLVVSMANVAASGGYYIAMPSKRLFADAGSITGSIGIYGGKPDLSGLYEKIDLGKELYTRGRFAGMLSWTRPFTDDERKKYFSHLSAFYGHFLELVAKDRSLPSDSIDRLAQGRVWTGREAAINGLVDELGGLKPALDYTAGTLSLKDYRIALFPEKRPWFILPGSSLLKTVAGLVAGGQDKTSYTADPLPTILPEGLYTRMPFDIDIE